MEKSFERVSDMELLRNNDKKLKQRLEAAVGRYNLSNTVEELYNRCLINLMAVQNDVGIVKFLENVSSYYLDVYDRIVVPLISNNEQQLLIDRNMKRCPHYFSRVDVAVQEIILGLEISLSNLLQKIPREYRDSFVKLTRSNQEAGDLRFFKFTGFPQWKDVASVFEGKYPIVDLRLGILISTAKRQGHWDWKELLYLIQNKTESVCSKNIPGDEFIATSQGFFCSSDGCDGKWYLSPHLSVNKEISHFLAEQKNVKIMFADTNKFDLNIK